MRTDRRGTGTRRPGAGGRDSPKRQAHYLVEFRFHGMAKEIMRDIASNVERYSRKSRQGALRRRMVPHITLAGPLTTNDEKQLVQEVVAACKEHQVIKFKLVGFDKFDDKVIYVKINPSCSLISLQKDITARLENFCELGEHDDLKRTFTFHGTLHMNKNGIYNFNKIWNYVNSFSIPEFDLYLARVTIIKNNGILCEYDLLLEKTLSRHESLNKSLAEKTTQRLAKIVDPPSIEYLQIDDREQLYVISDLHFDHTNIIQFCNRPFTNTEEMNRTMVENWTSTVEYNNKVFFLGDMTHGRNKHRGRNHQPIDFWLQMLTGNIWFIRGNHDRDIITKAKVVPTNYGIRYKGHEFLLAHVPYRPDGFDGWLIHGDRHNRDLSLYPLVNQKRRTVNISAELIDYTPISMDRIIDLIDTGRNHRTL